MLTDDSEGDNDEESTCCLEIIYFYYCYNIILDEKPPPVSSHLLEVPQKRSRLSAFRLNWSFDSDSNYNSLTRLGKRGRVEEEEEEEFKDDDVIGVLVKGLYASWSTDKNDPETLLNISFKVDKVGIISNGHFY